MCYCPPGTKYGREPAPAGSPPGTPPVKVGRPMGDSCKPNRVRPGVTWWGTPF